MNDMSSWDLDLFFANNNRSGGVFSHNTTTRDTNITLRVKGDDAVSYQNKVDAIKEAISTTN